MKRQVALALLGVAAIAATNSYGQGIIQFSNYVAPYVPITDGINAIGAGEGVTIELWGAPGAVGEGSLNYIADAAWSTTYAGYTDQNQIFVMPTTDATYSLQLRAVGTLLGQAVDEAASRGPVILTDQVKFGSPLPTPSLVRTPGFEVVVPEPTTFALAGLGAAALLIFRRRD